MIKEIINNQTPPKVVTLAELPVDAIVGILIENNTKGWIQCTSYDADSYTCFSVEGRSQGNNFCMVGQPWKKIKAWMHMQIESGNKCYLFDTENELFKWLSE